MMLNKILIWWIWVDVTTKAIMISHGYLNDYFKKEFFAFYFERVQAQI